MMKGNEDVYCSICEKSFSDFEFKNHFSLKHFSKKKFVCHECDTAFQYSNDLSDHLTEKHFTVKEKVNLKLFSPKNVFKDSKDIIRHTKESKHWIRYAFCYVFESPLNKKQLKSLVKDLYLDEQRDIQFNNLVCKFCDDINGNFYCYFCGKKFSSQCWLKWHLLDLHFVLPNSLKASTPYCNMCSTVFWSKTLLSEHHNEKHEHEPKKQTTSPFCQYCGKSLANKSNLKRHVLNQHSEQVGATPVNNVFTCHYCKCFFSNKSSVKRHIENLHLKEKDTRKSISCFQCEQRFNSIKNLNAHLTTEHDVKIHEENVQFSNLSEFWSWKKEEEIRTNSRFIQLRGLRRQRRKGEEISTLKFVCNRSGIFHSKSNGKRAYRIKGSSKIGRYCSAYIEIMFKENSSVEGVYCSTHSGHDNDLRYLALTMDEKREIYEKIKNGATFSAILNEIRNSVGKEIKRKHLVTNKDLHNIVTTFKKMSKPDSESSNVKEPPSPSSNNTSSFANINHADSRSDFGLSHDLDICADLWVDTCQRMINQFDQTQPRMPTVPSGCPKVDTSVKNHLAPSKNEFEGEIDPVVDPNCVKSDQPNFPNIYSHDNEYSSNVSSCSCLVQSVPSDANVSWPKQQNFSSFNSQEIGMQVGALESGSQFPNRLPVSARTRHELRDYCNMSDLMDGGQPSKDISSSNPSVSPGNDIQQISSHSIRSSSRHDLHDFCHVPSTIEDGQLSKHVCSLNPRVSPSYNTQQTSSHYVKTSTHHDLHGFYHVPSIKEDGQLSKDVCSSNPRVSPSNSTQQILSHDVRTSTCHDLHGFCHVPSIIEDEDLSKDVCSLNPRVSPSNSIQQILSHDIRTTTRHDLHGLCHTPSIIKDGQLSKDVRSSNPRTSPSNSIQQTSSHDVRTSTRHDLHGFCNVPSIKEDGQLSKDVCSSNPNVTPCNDIQQVSSHNVRISTRHDLHDFCHIPSMIDDRQPSEDVCSLNPSISPCNSLQQTSSHNVSSSTHHDLHSFCNIPNMIEDGQLSKDICSSNPSVSPCDDSHQISSHDLKTITRHDLHDFTDVPNMMNGRQLSKNTCSSNRSVSPCNNSHQTSSHDLRTSTHHDLHGFTNVPNMMDDRHQSKDTCSSNPNLSSSNRIERTSSHDRTSVLCQSAYYNLATSTTLDVNSVIPGMEDASTYNRLIDPSRLSNVFDSTYVVSERALSQTSEKREDDVENYACDSAASVVKAEQSCLKTENKNGNGISDLRDRVNSVTALYNIVESELDERKKNIIRSYVDNMFRILQYRYNKCKTKKKPSSNLKKIQSSTKGRLNRRRGNGKNQLKRKNLVKRKSKSSNVQKGTVQHSLSTSSSNFSSKNLEPYENDFSTPIQTDMRPIVQYWRKPILYNWP